MRYNVGEIGLVKYDVICGDSNKALKDFDDNTFDAVVTDPPYGLGEEPNPQDVMHSWLDKGYHEVTGTGFMNSLWDVFVPQPTLWREVYRVLKPGGYMLVACGTRTEDWMCMSLRFAGFEIRDKILQLYATGFPKSVDVSIELDKKECRRLLSERLGRKPTSEEFKDEWEGFREVIGQVTKADSTYHTGNVGGRIKNTSTYNITAPRSDIAKKYDGYGTALKPAVEIWIVARRPLEGTIAENVDKWGTGGINIDGSRIPHAGKNLLPPFNESKEKYLYGFYSHRGNPNNPSDYKGRFPSNIIIDEESGELLDIQSGITKSRPDYRDEVNESTNKSNIYGDSWRGVPCVIDDIGGASRFFFTAKASKSEREAGLDDLIKEDPDDDDDDVTKNDHVSVKPINLMRYLVNLVTPPDGLVLDCFAGSGTTGIACIIEGFDFVLIEMDEYFANDVIPRRLNYWSNTKHWDDLKEHVLLPTKKELVNKSLFEF